MPASVDGDPAGPSITGARSGLLGALFCVDPSGSGLCSVIRVAHSHCGYSVERRWKALRRECRNPLPMLSRTTWANREAYFFAAARWACHRFMACEIRRFAATLMVRRFGDCGVTVADRFLPTRSAPAANGSKVYMTTRKRLSKSAIQDACSGGNQ